MTGLTILKAVFIVLFIGIIYIIIFMALRIMYKDVKNGDKKKVLKKSLGLEIVEVGERTNLKKGSVVPIRSSITMGRKEDNVLILNDPYVSSHHARVYIKNTNCVVEDLGSTNGTLINEEKLVGSMVIETGDEIRIGSTLFRVIG